MSIRNIFTRSETGIVLESASFEDEYMEDEYYE